MNAYLSITKWPDHLDEADRIRLILQACGGDPYSARLVVIRETPMVAGRLPIDAAERAVNILRVEGVRAFAPTRDDLGTIRPLPRVKCLHPALGAPEPMYSVECWDGRTAVLKSRHIVLLVRARLETSTSRSSFETTLNSKNGAAVAFLGVQGAMLMSSLNGPAINRSTTFQSSHVLDVYVKNGQRIRIDGDKFNFSVLGGEKQYSDLENMDLLANRLAEEAPHALIETGFRNFKCPADVLSDAFTATGTSSMRKRSDAGPFDFYSAWTYWLSREQQFI